MLPSIWAGSLPAGFSFFFPALDSGCCPASGRGASSFFFLSCAGWRLLPGIRAGSPPGEGQGVKGDCFLLFRRWIADVAQHLGWVASRRGAGGRGLRRPLPPTTPYPALGAAILDGQQGGRRSYHWPPPCRAAAGVRPPAVPRGRGTSVRPASELPPLSGRRSPPRPAALTSTSGIAVPASQALRHPLMRGGRNGFPLLSQCTVPERRWTSGRTVRVVGGSPCRMTCPLPAARQRAFGLPLSREDAGRASVRRRSFRPCGAAISSAPCRAYVSKRNRRSRSASGTSSLDEGREKRLSVAESVHCAGDVIRC